MISTCLRAGAVASGLMFSLAQAAVAAEPLASDCAAFGPPDVRSPEGGRPGAFAAVLQQGRARHHRFGRPDVQDEGDPRVANRAARAKIPALSAAGTSDWWARVRSVRTVPLDAEVYVVVCGRAGQPAYLIADHANGDGDMPCGGPVSAGN